MPRIIMSSCNTGALFLGHNATEQLGKFMLLCAIGQDIRTCSDRMLERLKSIKYLTRSHPKFLLCMWSKYNRNANEQCLHYPFSLFAVGWKDGFYVPQKLRMGLGYITRESDIVSQWLQETHKELVY